MGYWVELLYSTGYKAGRKSRRMQGKAAEVSVIHAFDYVNPLTPELNPSTQRCLTRFLLGILLL
jgi:hypothetical protein